MTERVQVEPSEIKVGDLIEVEGISTQVHNPQGVIIYRDLVTAVQKSAIVTRDFTFATPFHNERTFYRLPKPAPEEPKGLGAVVELHDADGEPWLIVRVDADESEWQDSQGDIMNWSDWLVYSPYAKVLSEGYNA